MTNDNKMNKKELEFQRIARQSREFREQEEQRIAAEKEEEARRVAAEKEVERDRIAQAQRDSLEKQLDAEHDAEDDNNALLPSSSFDSKSSQPSPGTVAIRAEWLRKLEKDATARRALEDEFNALLAARRKNNPNEAVSESEAAVKAVLCSSTGDDSHHSHSLHSMFEEDAEPLIAKRLQYADDSQHSHSLYSVVEEDAEPHIAKRPQYADDSQHSHSLHAVVEEDLELQYTKSRIDEDMEVEGEEAKEQYILDDASTNTKSNVEVEVEAIDDEPQIIEVQSNSNNETKQQQPQQQLQQAVLEYGAEVDPRTQAMLAEDDFIPTGNNGEGDINISDFTQDRNKKKLVLENSIPVNRKKFRRVKKSSKTNLDDEDDSGSEIVYKQATFELPVEVGEDGLILSPDTADLSMITTIPPSRLGGRVSGRLEGKSSLGNKSNTASGSASLEYKASKHSRLTVGMIRGCEPYHPLITIGGRLLRHGSSIGVTFYHNAKFLHHMMLEHSLWSLSFRHCFPNSKWCLSSQLSRRQDLSLSVNNGNKLSGVIGWNLLKPKQFHARVDVRPRITEYRKAHLYCQWQALSGPGVWNFGVSLVQNLHSQMATFGLGWRLFSTRGLEWVISWSRGNATIRIPIVVSKGLAANTTIGHSLYFSMVSYFIQEYVAEVWGWIGNGEDDDGDTAENDRLLAIRAQNLTKSRQDAAVQKELMSRQAIRKTKAEKEKDGLIITKAIYQIENGEEWNATIPIQFWVSRSTLVLTAGPKSELLGFYDIAATLKNSRTVSSARDASIGQTRPLRRRFPSWNDIWCDLLDWTPKDTLLRKSKDLPSPTLTVWYEFKGQSHQITVKDREELRLPADDAL